MKREQIINKIYDKIRDDLLHAKLLYWEEDDDTNKYPLVDHLSSGDDISTGRDEIDNLIEQIEIEPLIDAILALPLDVPSDKEIEEQFPLIDYGFCTDIERVNIGYINSKRVNIQFGMKRMRDEIIKRNRVI